MYRSAIMFNLDSYLPDTFVYIDDVVPYQTKFCKEEPIQCHDHLWQRKVKSGEEI